MADDLKKQLLITAATAAVTALVSSMANVGDFLKGLFGREDQLKAIVGRQKSFMELTNLNARSFSQRIQGLEQRVSRMEGIQQGMQYAAPQVRTAAYAPYGYNPTFSAYHMYRPSI